MNLSLRGQETAKPGDTFVLYEVLRDPWNERTNPSGYVNLGVAENTLAHDRLSKHIHHNMVLASEHFTYGSGATGSHCLKKAMANFLSKHLLPFRTIQPSDITVTNGCSAAIEHLSWVLANPGEAFLLGQPYYGTFIPDLTLRTGAKVVPVPFNGVDPLSVDAVSKYEYALLDAQSKGVKVAGLVLCNPHNPLGRCYPLHFLVNIMLLCEKYRIHLISDEIYALSIWENTIDDKPEPTPFHSCLCINPQGIMDPSRIHIIWGMSKDFGANGIRIGAIISQQNPSLHTALTPVSLYSSPSSISEHVTANILNDDVWVEEYLATNRQNLKQHHELVVKWAKEHNITCMPGVNAAFFLWVDLGTAYRSYRPEQTNENVDDAIIGALLSNKIFLASGKSFGSEYPGWFRIVFSNHRHVLLEGLRRIIDTIQG